MTEFKVGDKVTIVDWGAQCEQCPHADKLAETAGCTKFVVGYCPAPQDGWKDKAHHTDGEIKYIYANKSAYTIIDIEDYYGSATIDDWLTQSELEKSIMQMGIWGTALELPSTEKSYEQKLAEMRQAIQEANDVYGRGKHEYRMMAERIDGEFETFHKAMDLESRIGGIMSNLRDDKFWDEQDEESGD